MNSGLEYKDGVQKLALQYSNKRIVLLTYYPKANRKIERAHKPIVDFLAKMSEDSSTHLIQNL